MRLLSLMVLWNVIEEMVEGSLKLLRDVWIVLMGKDVEVKMVVKEQNVFSWVEMVVEVLKKNLELLEILVVLRH